MWQTCWLTDSGSCLSSEMSLLRNIPWLSSWRDQDCCQSFVSTRVVLVWFCTIFFELLHGSYSTQLVRICVREGGIFAACKSYPIHNSNISHEDRLSLSLWGVWAEKCIESTGSCCLWIITWECTLGCLEDCISNWFRDKAGFPNKLDV